MPLTEKGKEILANMEKQYGETKGKSLFYASKNKGTISGVDRKKDSARRDAAMGVLDCVIDCMKADSKFEELVEKLEKKGYSHEYATKVAAKAGRDKYGAKGMAKKAAAARK